VNAILRTSIFDEWLKSLRDTRAQARIITRIRSAEAGSFGDWKALGHGVSDMRVDVGAGYRVYYMRQAATQYLLLLGGDKSTQQADIKRALRLVRELKQRKE
jgi:putative addiction module killer protein